MDIQPKYLILTDLLANRLFRIPVYQRAYSWTKKQRGDMLNDILALRNMEEDSFHFMATIVGLRRETKTIVTDQYRVVDIVDGQQRITTLVLLLKAIEKKLNRKVTAEDRLADELQELLVKQDNVSLILLQTNHDYSHYFVNYLRQGERPPVDQGQTLADRELLSAMHECEEFVDAWDDRIELLRTIKNQLTFIFHEIDQEAAVYTVFEVLNNRGLGVAWLDRLKSMLMAVAFEYTKGNADEHIEELHRIWGSIYQNIGLRQGMSTESLRFTATLLPEAQRLSKPFGEADAVASLVKAVNNDASRTIEMSQWLLKVTEAVDKFLIDTRRLKAITKIAQVRLLALAIMLRGFDADEEAKLLDVWEKTSFRVYGLCKKDARTAVGDYVRLSWDLVNKTTLGVAAVENKIRKIGYGKELGIEWAEAGLPNSNRYENWEEELRYFLFRYEEHLAAQEGQNFSNEQWGRIWEASAAKSIEHIVPQSKGSEEPVNDEDTVFVHRLGNLLLLPPGLNSKLGNLDPRDKADAYRKTGLLCAVEVANTIAQENWGKKQVEEREQRLVTWMKSTWA